MVDITWPECAEFSVMIESYELFEREEKRARWLNDYYQFINSKYMTYLDEKKKLIALVVFVL